jgi:hypothetical protein
VHHLTDTTTADRNHVVAQVVALKRMLVGDMHEPAAVSTVNARLYHWGATALTLAALGGASEGVLMLLEAGADIDALDVDGCSALLHAAQSGHASCVRLLLEGGAKVDVRERRQRWTPLMKAAQVGHVSLRASSPMRLRVDVSIHALPAVYQVYGSLM